MQYETELQNISHVLRRNKDARITLTGFADRRGEQGFNLSLSEDRVDAVQQYLVRHGVSKQQIISTAYGESQPLNSMESLENNFFDRRVLIELNIDIDPQLATR
jgi:outer membrane protein OmpA-like peptidoglycan-associated protein